MNHYRLASMYQDTAVFWSSSDALPGVANYRTADSVFSGGREGTDTLTAPPHDTLTEVPSIFRGHHLLPDQTTTMERSYGNEDWITIHIVLAMMVFSWVRLFYSNRLRQVFRSSLGVRFQGIMMREGNILRERISIALMIVYLISTSLVVYLVFTRLLELPAIQLKSFRLFSLIMLIVIFLWVLKNVANMIVGNVFQNPVVLNDYIVTNFVFNIVRGSVLLPVLVLAVYIPSVEMLYLAVIIWGLFFVYRLLRLLFTSLSYTKFSLFNRFLYLCTFEIAPVVVIIKLVMSNLE